DVVFISTLGFFLSSICLDQITCPFSYICTLMWPSAVEVFSLCLSHSLSLSLSLSVTHVRTQTHTRAVTRAHLPRHGSSWSSNCSLCNSNSGQNPQSIRP